MNRDDEFDKKMKSLIDFALETSSYSTYRNAMDRVYTPQSQPTVGANSESADRFVNHKYLYIALYDKAQGPFSLSDVLDMVRRGVVTSQTLVWKEGMEQWIPAEQIVDICPNFDTVPPKLPK